ncbi:hypothetical protein WSM22_21360 [Cytophagales bacterium WSM2-2]|nr:hypothetical protein WSM22_21360 [Cytophagales bacterium WSM2-2]
MKRYLFLSLTLLSISAAGQSAKPDSLLNSILSKPDDTLKVVLLNRYSTSIRENNGNEALRVADIAKSIAEKLNFRKGLAPILENTGWISYRRGNYAKALALGTEALKIYNEFGDKRGAANCSNNISAILTEQGRHDDALRILRRAFLIAQELGEYGVMARCANNAALNFLPKHQLDSALYYTQLAIELGAKAKDEYRIAFAKRTLGDIFMEKKNYEGARKNLFEALIPSNRGGNVFLEASTLYRIGKTYFLSKEYDQALIYLNKNKVIAEKFGFKSELERTYKMMADIYRVKNDMAKVVLYTDKYLIVHDSLLIQRSNERMALNQAKFESDLQQAQIDLLKKDSLLKEEELKGKQLWNNIFIGGLIVLAGIGIVLYYTNLRVKKYNIDLQERNRKINEQTIQLRDLNATKDKIFSIISHDLRSPLASLRGLMDLASGANLSQEEFLRFAKSLKNNLDYVSDDLDNLLSWARSQSKGIVPQFGPSNPFSIVKELHDLYGEAARMKNIELENTIDESVHIHADRNHLKLILRNLIGNSIKFSDNGGNVSTACHVHSGKVALSVTDRGKGMSEEEVEKLFFIGTHFTTRGTNNEKGLGIGLLLVKEFVEKNNGTISVVSELGKGSTFTIMLQGHSASAPVN